jgi:hypothetical protein
MPSTKFLCPNVKNQREKKANNTPKAQPADLFRARGVLGDGLGAFRHGVLGQLTREDEADGGLDFTGGDSGLLVVGSKLAGLGGNTLEDICWEGRDKGQTRRAMTRVRRVGLDDCLPLTKEFRMDMARLEIPVSGWTCLRTGKGRMS